MYRFALALALVGCSAEASQPATGFLPICPDEAISANDLDLAETVWGAYVDCSDPETVVIQAVDVPCDNAAWAGCAARGGNWVQIVPTAPNLRVGIAHELGHVMGLIDSADDCDLMNHTAGHCGYVVFTGHVYY